MKNKYIAFVFTSLLLLSHTVLAVGPPNMKLKKLTACQDFQASAFIRLADSELYELDRALEKYGAQALSYQAKCLEYKTIKTVQTGPAMNQVITERDKTVQLGQAADQVVQRIYNAGKYMEEAKALQKIKATECAKHLNGNVRAGLNSFANLQNQVSAMCK